jgi:hypothetical protein
LLLSVPGCTDDGRGGSARPEPAGETPAHEFVAADGGVTVRYPDGWSATARNDTPVDNPALCFAVRRSHGRGPRGVEIKLVEYLPPFLDRRDVRGPNARYRPRPKHFRYGGLESSDVRWTTGRTFYFAEHGRAFFVGVAVRRTADAGTRRTVERILDTIHAGSGRCRPGAGVGARSG